MTTMKRPRPIVGPLSLFLAALVLAACGAGDSVPTYEVARRAFTHKVTAEGHLQAAKATVLTVPPDVQRTVRLAWLAPEGSLMATGDVVARFDPRPMEEQLADGRSQLDSATLKVEKADVESRSKVAEQATAVAVADLELRFAERFQKTDAAVFSRHEILEEAIDEELARHRQEHAAVGRRIQGSLAATERQLLAIDQRKAQLKIDQAIEGLDALEVRAPHGGILTLARDWRGESPTVGSEMWSGQEIGEIPDLGRMQAEVYVLEADAGGLEIGQAATVLVEAHPESPQGARIARVDAVAKPKRRGSPVQYFGVTLDLEDAASDLLKPGQRVRATLLLAQEEAALVVPRQAVVQQQGRHWVYVRSGGGFVPRQIDVGAASMGLMVVADGLVEGDRIALRPTGDPAVDAPAPSDPASGDPEPQHAQQPAASGDGGESG